MGVKRRVHFSARSGSACLRLWRHGEPNNISHATLFGICLFYLSPVCVYSHMTHNSFPRAPALHTFYVVRDFFTFRAYAPTVLAALSYKSPAHFFRPFSAFSSFAKHTGTSSRFSLTRLSPTRVALRAPGAAALRVGPYRANSGSLASRASAIARTKAAAAACSECSEYLRALCA